MLKRLPAKRKASGAGFGYVFLWSLLAALCMVLFAGPAAANASNASVVFSGYVPERGQGSFHIEQEQLVAFGATGGVRLHAANPTRSAARLTYVVLDGSNNIIAGGQGPAYLVPPGQRLETIVDFPLESESLQRFRLCAVQEYAASSGSSSKCFQLSVTRLD